MLTNRDVLLFPSATYSLAQLVKDIYNTKEDDVKRSHSSSWQTHGIKVLMQDLTLSDNECDVANIHADQIENAAALFTALATHDFIILQTVGAPSGSASATE